MKAQSENIDEYEDLKGDEFIEKLNQISKEEYPVHEFDKDIWKKYADDVNSYDAKDKKKKEEQVEKDGLKSKKSSQQEKSFFDFDKQIKWVLISIVIIILLLVLYFIFRSMNSKINRKVNKISDIDFDELDEKSIRELDTNSLLLQALESQNFILAFRIRYLAVLQYMIEQNIIEFRKEYTNFQYIIQLGSHKAAVPFRKLSYYFDSFWYGEIVVTKELYDKSCVDFDIIDTLLREELRS